MMIDLLEGKQTRELLLQQSVMAAQERVKNTIDKLQGRAHG